MDDLKVRITLGDTTLEGTLDELLESGTFKMEYDQAGLNKIVQEAVALQRAEYQKDPQHHAVDFAAFLDLVPVNAALPAGNVKYCSWHCSAPPLQYSKCLPHKLANSYRCHHWAKS